MKEPALPRTLVDFMYFCNKLKLELRHCWFEGGRRESVAEHSWQMALFAMTVIPHLEIEISHEKVLKMILIHDLVEIEANDIPVFTQDKKTKVDKNERESKAILNIRKMLPSALGEEIFMLWHEYEDLNTNEAKVVKALDRLEAFIAHNVSDIDTILDVEKQMYSEDKWLIEPCLLDPLLLSMAKIVNSDGMNKITSEVKAPLTENRTG